MLHADAPAATVRMAIDLNWRACMRAFGSAPGVTIRDDQELFWFITGLPDPAFNSIMYACLAPDRIDAALAEFHRLRTTYQVPMSWLVGPSSTPADLAHQLAERGLHHRSSLTPMTIQLGRLPAARSEPAGLRIERVATAAQYQTWIATEQQGFELDGPLAIGLVRLRQGMGASPSAPIYHYLGILDGTPVATASLLPAGGIAGVYDVATIPVARRQGIGTAMTLAVLHAARQLGYSQAWLQPSDMGQTLYRRIGFGIACICLVYR